VQELPETLVSLEGDNYGSGGAPGYGVQQRHRETRSAIRRAQEAIDACGMTDLVMQDKNDVAAQVRVLLLHLQPWGGNDVSGV
jgi:hypothetical protein